MIAALTQAIDNFGKNDQALRDLLIAQLDTELAEIESERAQINAALNARRERIAARKVAVDTEFEQRKGDLEMILEGGA